MLIISDVRKSTNFSNEKPFAVVRFRKNVEGSKFAKASLNSGGVYSSTYNLQIAYPDATNEDDKFDANRAFTLFKEEMRVGAEEPINGYDVEVSEVSNFAAVKIPANGLVDERIMKIIRPAVYGDREDAKRIAKASLQRQIKAKTFIGMTEEDLEEDGEED